VFNLKMKSMVKTAFWLALCLSTFATAGYAQTVSCDSMCIESVARSSILQGGGIFAAPKGDLTVTWTSFPKGCEWRPPVDSFVVYCMKGDETFKSIKMVGTDNSATFQSVPSRETYYFQVASFRGGQRITASAFKPFDYRGDRTLPKWTHFLPAYWTLAIFDKLGIVKNSISALEGSSVIGRMAFELIIILFYAGILIWLIKTRPILSAGNIYLYDTPINGRIIGLRQIAEDAGLDAVETSQFLDLARKNNYTRFIEAARFKKLISGPELDAELTHKLIQADKKSSIEFYDELASAEELIKTNNPGTELTELLIAQTRETFTQSHFLGRLRKVKPLSKLLCILNRRYSLRRMHSQWWFDHLPTVRVLRAVSLPYDNEQNLYSNMELTIAAEEEELKKRSYIEILWAIGVTTPLLGLFGTVTGISQSFMKICSSTAGDPQLISTLSGGIFEALFTTIYGLIAGITLMLVFYYYNYKLDRVSVIWVTFASQYVDCHRRVKSQAATHPVSPTANPEPGPLAADPGSQTQGDG